MVYFLANWSASEGLLKAFLHVKIPEDVKYMEVSQKGQVGGPGPDWGGQSHCPSLIYNLNIISHPLSVEDCISDASRCLRVKVWPTIVTSFL